MAGFVNKSERAIVENLLVQVNAERSAKQQELRAAQHRLVELTKVETGLRALMALGDTDLVSGT